jgi:hypothetical protein
MNFTTILSLPVLLPAITPGLATPQAPAFPSSIKAPLTATVQLSFGVAPSGQTYNGPAC